jgi:hypothetical protein
MRWVCLLTLIGMLSLPSSLAVVGIVPGLILIIFLGIFGTFTSWILIQFKLNHPEGEIVPLFSVSHVPSAHLKTSSSQHGRRRIHHRRPNRP